MAWSDAGQRPRGQEPAGSQDRRRRCEVACPARSMGWCAPRSCHRRRSVNCSVPPSMVSHSRPDPSLVRTLLSAAASRPTTTTWTSVLGQVGQFGLLGLRGRRQRHRGLGRATRQPGAAGVHLMTNSTNTGGPSTSTAASSSLTSRSASHELPVPRPGPQRARTLGAAPAKGTAKDCANGGIFQMEPERSDGTRTRIVHTLGAGSY